MAFQKGNKLGKGRPKSANSWAVQAKKYLAEVDPDSTEKRTRIYEVLDSTYKQAKAGDVAAAKFLVEYSYGKPSPDAEQNGQTVNLIIHDPSKATPFEAKEPD